ncbi:MAG: hypothetical protein WDZ69_02620 [Candidatus Pacearchaeota archaeon]
MCIKNLDELDKEINNRSSDNSLLVLDTGGLIEIANKAREYNLVSRGKDVNPNYMRATSFLDYISENVGIIITPKTYQEIQDHGRMKLNGHTQELTPRIVDRSLEIMIGSEEYISGLECGLEPDQARYDAYWASKEGCNGNSKKYVEGCSETDKEILSTVAYLSNCNVGDSSEEGRENLLVLSSDDHIILGSEFLKKNFKDRYSNIVPISTRRR